MAPGGDRALASRKIHALSIHADYRCRSSGVCCSSGWDIPVEPEVEDRLRAALGKGTLRVPAPEVEPGADPYFRACPGLSHDARVVLASDARGRCVFLETGRDNLCAVHRQLGFAQVPAACRDFPRLVTLTPLGVSITLSHYCPTAAELVFRESHPLTIEPDPPAFPPSWPYEGLDAREALPPLLRPGVLMSWDAFARWEAHAVATLARADLTPERALDLLARQAEEVRSWTMADGNFDLFFERGLADEPPSDEARPLPLGACREAWRWVADCVPSGPPPPLDTAVGAGDESGSAAAMERRVDEGWATLGEPLRRWLAARAFASWIALQGGGLRTTVLGLSLALAVLRAEAARGVANSQRALDPDGLREAIRRADLLLVHLANPQELARRLSGSEAMDEMPSGGVVASWRRGRLR